MVRGCMEVFFFLLQVHGEADQAKGDLAPKVTSQEQSGAADTTQYGKIN